MPTKLRAIFPKNQITASFIQPRIRQWLEVVIKEFREEMQEYPPIQPWKHGFPKSGPRRKGRRTGRYKRGWNRRARFTPDSATLTNEVPYSVYVGGSRRAKTRGTHQASHMRDRGWKSVTNVSANVVRRNRRRLQRAIMPFKVVP